MKKLLAIVAVAVGLSLIGTAGTAEAGHGRSYRYSFTPRTYHYRYHSFRDPYHHYRYGHFGHFGRRYGHGGHYGHHGHHGRHGGHHGGGIHFGGRGWRIGIHF